MTDTTTKPAEDKPAPKRKRAAAKPKTNGTAPKPREAKGPTAYTVWLQLGHEGAFERVGVVEVPANTRRVKVREVAGQYVVAQRPDSGPYQVLTTPLRDEDSFPVRAVQTTIVEVGS